MRGVWTAMVFALLCAGGLFAYVRWSSRVPAESSPNLRGGEVLPVDERIDLSDGVEDVKNQFAFAVMVKASVSAEQPLKCTGVLISPRLVLTAGHCVCSRHRFTGVEGDARFVIDGSVCAEAVEVTAIIYHPREAGSVEPPGFQAQSYRAKVSVHPALKVLLDEQSSPLSSTADLAVALLEQPLRAPLLPVRLADSEAKLGEILLMAGYGFDATTDLIHGVRRSGQKEVKRLPDGSDGVLLGAHGAPFTTGSGEPCLRLEEAGLALVGLSGKGSGGLTGCTSVHMHREWLEVEMQKATASPSGDDGGDRK